MSTHNIGFYEEISKINISLNYHQISSNTHLISTAGLDVRKTVFRDCSFTVSLLENSTVQNNL